MRQHTFKHGGSGQLSWTVDKDTVLVGVSATAATVISTDPAMTLAIWQGLSSSKQFDGMFVTTETGNQLIGNLLFPLVAGEVVFSAVGVANIVQLYLEDV